MITNPATAGLAVLRIRFAAAAVVLVTGILVAIVQDGWRGGVGVGLAVLGLVLAIDTRLLEAAARDAYQAAGSDLGALTGTRLAELQQRTRALLRRHRIRASRCAAVVVASWAGISILVGFLVST